MIVLQEKGLWEGIPNKLLEFSKKEHKGEDVLKMNPRGQVSNQKSALFFLFTFFFHLFKNVMYFTLSLLKSRIYTLRLSFHIYIFL